MSPVTGRTKEAGLGEFTTTVFVKLTLITSPSSTRPLSFWSKYSAWAIRTAPDLGYLMQKETVETRKLSRAAIETLAIIAYHQPVTRAEIEEIRGVSVSRGTVDQLIELEWIRFGRRRMTPGRPVTFVVTQNFLDHFGLESARDLPGLKELRAAGLLDSRPPPGPGLTPGPESDDEDEAEEGQSELFED